MIINNKKFRFIANTHFYSYDLSENVSIGVTYTEDKQEETRETPGMHSIEVIKLRLNGDDVTDKLEFLIDDIQEDIISKL